MMVIIWHQIVQRSIKMSQIYGLVPKKVPNINYVSVHINYDSEHLWLINLE